LRYTVFTPVRVGGTPQKLICKGLARDCKALPGRVTLLGRTLDGALPEGVSS
jgi:hypothetical protein